MRKAFFLLLATIVLCSHDLYLKMETYFVQPNQQATLSLYNGTFEESENTIARDRMLDASVVAHGERVAIHPDLWEDLDSIITQVTFNTDAAGTYVAGVSTKARNIELKAEEFNDYLKHDGVLDMLEQRDTDGTSGQDAVESYQKHVKAIYQVGDVKTNDWSTVLGYPIELVPLANPYEKYSGDKLEVQLLLDGKPLPNQRVYADYISNTDDHTHDHAHADGAPEHSHDSETAEAHTHTSGQQLRTDDRGVVMVDLPEDGIYYIRTINMTTVTDSDELTHRSRWATLTFEVSHRHDANTHAHDHDHDHTHGFPTWVLALGGLLIIGLLFLVFRKKD